MACFQSLYTYICATHCIIASMGKGNEPTPSWRWCKCHKVIKCRINSEMLILDRPLRPNLCALQPSILCSISNFPHERGKFKNGEKYAMWIGNLSFLPWYPDCSMPKNASGIHEMRCISPSMWCDAWKLERERHNMVHILASRSLCYLQREIDEKVAVSVTPVSCKSITFFTLTEVWIMIMVSVVCLQTNALDYVNLTWILTTFYWTSITQIRMPNCGSWSFFRPMLKTLLVPRLFPGCENAAGKLRQKW